FCEQSNGFNSKTLSCRWIDGGIEFSVSKEETFVLGKDMKKIEIFFPEKYKKGVEACIEYLFSYCMHATANEQAQDRQRP
ncbi:MAG: hypothetical protein LBL69_06200, partial [Zoogloeaceae bacterium]|nr:hypothetical protein [Zoogloeaceae bacterium]